MLKHILLKALGVKRPGRDADLDRLRELLIRFEGMKFEAYECPAGTPTIGCGATRTLGNRPVQMGMKITAETAYRLLDRDAGRAYDSAVRMLRADAGNGARVAFASLIFNVGARKVARSNALREYNAGNIAAAEREFKEWRKGGGRVLPGLVRRRNAEWKLIAEETD